MLKYRFQYIKIEKYQMEFNWIFLKCILNLVFNWISVNIFQIVYMKYVSTQMVLFDCKDFRESCIILSWFDNLVHIVWKKNTNNYVASFRTMMIQKNT